jgi:hypothetical protein
MRCSIGEWLTQQEFGHWMERRGRRGASQQPNNQKKTKGIAHKNTAAVPKTWAKSGGHPENKMADYCGLSVPIPENSCIVAALQHWPLHLEFCTKCLLKLDS